MNQRCGKFFQPMKRAVWWLRFGVFFAVFAVFTGIEPKGLAFGAVAAAIASVISHRLGSLDMGRLDLAGLLQFLPYFLTVSIRGGIDVARRAFSPSMPIAPGVVEYELRVEPAGAAAVFFAAIISLIPGTLCLELTGSKTVVVHVIDLDSDYRTELQRLERRAAAVFGETLEDEKRGGP